MPAAARKIPKPDPRNGQDIDPLSIALDLKAAQDEVRQVSAPSTRLSDFDVASAYEVASIVHGLRVQEGATPVGRKLGFTNRGIWRQYRVEAPIWGYIYQETVFSLEEARGVCSLRGLTEPRIEPEIVFCLDQVPTPDCSLGQLVNSIAWVAHGFELVQSHFPGWEFRAPDTIADGALHGRLVIGPPVPVTALGGDPQTVLESFELSLSCDGRVVASGSGSAVLGSPLLALRHLIEALAADPKQEPLAAGEIVTTGTITDAHVVQAGETWQSNFEGIALQGLVVAVTE